MCISNTCVFKQVEKYYKKALKHLNLNVDEYEIRGNTAKDVKFRKGFDSKIQISDKLPHNGYYAYFYEKKIIVVDEDHILKNKKNPSIWKKIILHEVRHAYQYKQIELYDNNSDYSESEETILKWKNDFYSKRKNIITAMNITEIDANEYAEKNWDKV